MNVENIKRVRDHIAGLPPERFDMTRYFSQDGIPLRDSGQMSDCGTAACIAGWAVALLSPEPVQHFVNACAIHVSDCAADLLGLDRPSAARLFMPSPADNDFDGYEASPAEAARVLDHLIATGEVDWSVAPSS